MIEEYNSIEKRCSLFYKDRYIDNEYDRIEVEKQIIETIFNDYKEYIPNSYIYLNFVYSGLLDEGYSVAPSAICRINGIDIYIDNMDGAVNWSIMYVAKMSVINTLEEAITCWEILFAQCAWTILHEMTHCAEVLDMHMMHSPAYVTMLENTSDAMALHLIQEDMNVNTEILDMLSKAHFGDKPMIPVMNSIFLNNNYDLAEYYYQILKEAFQVFGPSNTEDGRYIMQQLQYLIYTDPKNLMILDRINNPDNQNGLVVKLNGEFLYPTQYFADLIFKLMHILSNKVMMQDGYLYMESTVTIDSIEYNCIAVTGAFLYTPFIKEDFLHYLNLSDVYNFKKG